MKKILLLFITWLTGLTVLQAQNEYVTTYVDLGRQSGVIYQPIQKN